MRNLFKRRKKIVDLKRRLQNGTMRIINRAPRSVFAGGEISEEATRYANAVGGTFPSYEKAMWIFRPGELKSGNTARPNRTAVSSKRKRGFEWGLFRDWKDEFRGKPADLVIVDAEGKFENLDAGTRVDRAGNFIPSLNKNGYVPVAHVGFKDHVKNKRVKIYYFMRARRFG